MAVAPYTPPLAPLPIRRRRRMGALLGAPDPVAAPAPAPPSPEAPARASSTIQQPGEPLAPDYDFNPDTGRLRSPGGRPFGAKKIRRAIMGLQYEDMLRAQPSLWAALGQLAEQANTFDPTGAAPQYAGQFERATDMFEQARGRLTRDLMARGLGDSAAMASGLGQIAGQEAASLADIARGIYRDETQRQQLAQAQLRDLLMALLGRSSSQAADIAGAIRNEQLQRRMMEGGSALGDLLGGLFGLGGLAAGLGWRPFGGLPRTGGPAG